MAATALAIRDEPASDATVDLVGFDELDTNDRALANDGTIFNVMTDAIKVAATNVFVVSPTTLGQIREQRLWNVRSDRFQTVPPLPRALLEEPRLFEALELVVNGDKKEVFLRAVAKGSLGLTSKSASHDRVHLWPLALSTLSTIKRNMLAGMYDRSVGSYDKVRSYFSSRDMPADEVKDVAALRTAETDPTWRLGRIGDETPGFAASQLYKQLQDKSLGFTKAQKRKHDLNEQLEQVTAVGTELDELKKHVRKVYETPHGKDFVLEGSFDLGSVSFLPITNADGSTSLLVRTMKKM